MDYEKLINRIKKAYLYAQTDSTRAVLEEILPELKESEDERMKQAILGFLEGSGMDCELIPGIKIEDAVAWLEKQGEQKVPVNDFKAKDWYYSKVDGKRHNIYHSVDNIEPKFKVGDWIVNNDSGCVDKVTEIRDDEYCLWPLDAEIEGYLRIIDVDNDYHLWTTQDAKDGDVLVDSYSKDSIIILYKGIYKERSILAHCGWNGYNLSIKTNGLGYGGLDNTNYSPATKEQRDLLFQKIKEKGYEWDAEKKELKKIHVIDEGKAEMDYCFTKMMAGEKVSPTWNEDDEEKFRDVIRLIEQGAPVQSMRDHYTNWFKSLKERIEG